MEASPTKLKLVLIGNSGVGKSSIMNRFVHNRYTSICRSTIGCDLIQKTVRLQDEIITLEIWDTAGLEMFNSLGPSFYRGAHCCILVYDVTSKASFSALDKWRNEVLLEHQNPSALPFIVLGNKTDTNGREVSRHDAKKWCKEIDANYFEGSAKEDVEVEKCFLKAALIALRCKKNTSENTGSVKITPEPQSETRKTTCC